VVSGWLAPLRGASALRPLPLFTDFRENQEHV
jgi:hypothetical protein